MHAFRSISLEASKILIAIVLGSTALHGEAQESFVPVSAEPHHRMKLDTAKYRVYEVLVNPGETTLFHEHKADNFAVMLSQSDLTNEFQGGQKTDASVKPGMVAFAAASPAKSYVHRVLLRGGAPFRNITIELLQPQGAAVADSEQIDPALSTVRESPRGRAFRVNLEPEQSVKLPSRVSDIFLVCLSDGSVVQQIAAQSTTTWNCKVGDFRLLEKPREAVLKSQAPTKADLVVIAVQ
jgi:hypothetical protein